MGPTTPITSEDLAEGNLGRGTSILQFGEMRKNYAFLRISNNTAIKDLDGQLVVTSNLNDGSWFGYLSIDYTITKNLIAGIYGLVTFGQKGHGVWDAVREYGRFTY